MPLDDRFGAENLVRIGRGKGNENRMQTVVVAAVAALRRHGRRRGCARGR